MRIAGCSGDDEQVGALAGLDRAEVLVPAQDLGRVARRERDQVDVRQAAAVQAVDEPGQLQLAEQVLAPAGRPVRAERGQNSGVVRLAHVGRLPVEEQVAERRPDHRRPGLCEHLEVLLLERDAVDPGQRARDRPVPVRPLERQEMLARLLVRALAQVQQQAVEALETLQELRPVLRLDVGDVRAPPRAARPRRSARRCGRSPCRSAGCPSSWRARSPATSSSRRRGTWPRRSGRSPARTPACARAPSSGR